jgi:tRNA (cytidine/uridine-2'-O-)-methyltransferase
MSSEGLHLVLVTPEIPANTGNIARLCAVTGVELHLVEPLGFQLDARLVRRAGLDYWDDCRLRVHLTFEEIEAGAPADAFHFLAARAASSFFERRIRSGDWIVLGPESTGLGPRFLECNQRSARACRLPMPGRGRSLNLSTAAGVAVYEALRQLGRLRPSGPESPCPA